MHCPKCGQLQVSEETRFCSRCGFLMTGVTQLVARGGMLPGNVDGKQKSVSTPRNRGLKQGLFVFLLSFLVVPIIAILTLAVGAEPYAVVISAILLAVGGLLRAAYALMFESNEPYGALNPGDPIDNSGYLSGSGTAGSLPPQQSVPADAYVSPAGNWRDTSDLQAHPHSVTDSTTKLLQKEADDQ
jgi:hypothetical protein